MYAVRLGYKEKKKEAIFFLVLEDFPLSLVLNINFISNMTKQGDRNIFVHTFVQLVEKFYRQTGTS